MDLSGHSVPCGALKLPDWGPAPGRAKKKEQSKKVEQNQVTDLTSSSSLLSHSATSRIDLNAS